VNAEIVTTMLLSIKVGLVATVINVPIAVVVSWAMSRRDFVGKALVDGLINLPLVVPPVATGYLLLLLLGRNGLVGAALFSWFGMRIAYTTSAAVIASMVVSFPLVARSTRVAMEMVDGRLEQTARSLGASRLQVLLRITLPLSMKGILGGALLGFARSLGEFGATMVFAGNIEGETRTIPLSVYSLMQIPGREGGALLLVLVSVGISLATMVLSGVLVRRPESEGARA